MALELELSLRIVEEDEAISTALEEDSSSISVSLAEALSLSQATSIADKAKVPTKSFVKFIEPSVISIYRRNLINKKGPAGEALARKRGNLKGYDPGLAASLEGASTLACLPRSL